jgi:predicted esterase YcpF (UPF0227 family)
MKDHIVTREDYEDPSDTVLREKENAQYETERRETLAEMAQDDAEVDEYEQFHAAYHVVMNQIVDDAENHEIIDYVGCMRVTMMLFDVAKKDGIVKNVVSRHLDCILETLFHCDIEL